ncbi:putative reverse transcriptase domain-containing protein [Tanacetum coccineum]|uniref:Reverse transcriptase domain-containing protein n=1 Tax=Tanacetum coccineum TaxID=301880 RepID=A0ABQ5E1K0_9ASTR
MSGCRDNQKVKYTTGSFVGKALTWWNSQIHTQSREAAVSMSWEDFKTLTREEFCLSNEMQKLETELWNHAMVRAGHATYSNRFHELARLVPHLVTPKNKRIEKYMYGLAPQIQGMVAATEPTTIQKVGDRMITRDFGLEMLLLITTILLGDCGVVPRNVNPTNARNLAASRGACFKCGDWFDHYKSRMSKGRGNNSNQACGRAFMLGAKEARQDPNIMTGTFTLNNPYAITLFDSGADYSFVSTTFIPLLGIEPSDLRFSYEIEIASRQLVEIDKVIKGCKLEIDGHVFDINLISFGNESFDVIIGMDWLSNHKAKIICHEKVVRIPLLDGNVLRVLGERLEEKERHLMSAKAKEQKQEKMVMVRDFPENEVHLGLVLELLKEEKLYAKFSKCEFWLREVHFLGHVINGDGIHIDPSKIEAVKNWEALRTPFEVCLFLGLASKSFDWGEEQESAFQNFEGLQLCMTPISRSPDGPNILWCSVMHRGLRVGNKEVSLYDLKSLQHFYNQKETELRVKRRWLDRAFRVYDYKIRYLPVSEYDYSGPRKVESDESAGLQRGLDEMIERRSDGALYYLDRIWVPLRGDVRTLIIDEAHKLKLEVRLEAVGWLQQPEIPKWKWEWIAMDFVMKLPRTSSRHDTIWVIVDRLTKSAHFVPMREDYKMDSIESLWIRHIELYPLWSLVNARTDTPYLP